MSEEIVADLPANVDPWTITRGDLYVVTRVEVNNRRVAYEPISPDQVARSSDGG